MFQRPRLYTPLRATALQNNNTQNIQQPSTPASSQVIQAQSNSATQEKKSSQPKSKQSTRPRSAAKPILSDTVKKGKEYQEMQKQVKDKPKTKVLASQKQTDTILTSNKTSQQAKLREQLNSRLQPRPLSGKNILLQKLAQNKQKQSLVDQEPKIQKQISQTDDQNIVFTLHYLDKEYKLKEDKKQTMKSIVIKYLEKEQNLDELKFICGTKQLVINDLNKSLEDIMKMNKEIYIFHKIQYNIPKPLRSKMNKLIVDRMYTMFQLSLNIQDQYIETDGYGITIINNDSISAIVNFEGHTSRHDYEIL